MGLVTVCNTSRYTAENAHDEYVGFRRALRPIFPIAVVAATMIAAGCMQGGPGQASATQTFDTSLNSAPETDSVSGAAPARSATEPTLSLAGASTAAGWLEVRLPRLPQPAAPQPSQLLSVFGPAQVAASSLAVSTDAVAHLPAWVQAHRATRLWSGPDEKAVVLTDLPQWTFLKVVGDERDGRVLVHFGGDYASRQAGVGWVDGSSIGPADDPGTWVTNHRPATLWSGTDAAALKFNDIPQWTKLRIVDNAPPNTDRLAVQYFGDGNTRAAGTAWIARTDVGPITPPTPLPTAAALGLTRQSASFASPDDFISAVGAAAQRSRQATHVPASVTVAQAILESDWGRSRLTRQANNLFGIKALASAGPAGVINLSTWENIDGSDVVIQAPFKAYSTLQQSIDDHARFLNGWRYSSAMAVADDARAFAREIQADGYATDPNYASKLISLMDRYDLYRFDR